MRPCRRRDAVLDRSGWPSLPTSLEPRAWSWHLARLAIFSYLPGYHGAVAADAHLQAGAAGTGESHEVMGPEPQAEPHLLPSSQSQSQSQPGSPPRTPPLRFRSDATSASGGQGCRPVAQPRTSDVPRNQLRLMLMMHIPLFHVSLNEPVTSAPAVGQHPHLHAPAPTTAHRPVLGVRPRKNSFLDGERSTARRPMQLLPADHGPWAGRSATLLWRTPAGVRDT